MNLRRLPAVYVLALGVAGLALGGCAQTAGSARSGEAQDVRRPDSGARLMESSAQQQRMVDSNASVGQHTK